jgi:hypothetical protein
MEEISLRDEEVEGLDWVKFVQDAVLLRDIVKSVMNFRDQKRMSCPSFHLSLIIPSCPFKFSNQNK